MQNLKKVVGIHLSHVIRLAELKGDRLKVHFISQGQEMQRTSKACITSVKGTITNSKWKPILLPFLVEQLVILVMKRLFILNRLVNC